VTKIFLDLYLDKFSKYFSKTVLSVYVHWSDVT